MASSSRLFVWKFFKHCFGNRLSSLGLESWDMGGGCDCFFHCVAPLVGMTVPVLRRCVAQNMKDNEHIYEGLGDFELYGGYQNYAIWQVHVESTLKAYSL